MEILTHRGLDPSKKDYFLESSYEAFIDQIKRGFGLEFDLQFTRDNGIIISHDANLARISEGSDPRNISDLVLQEVANLTFHNCHLSTLRHLLDAIRNHGGETHYAIHLKYRWQAPQYLAIFLRELEDADIDWERFFVFDVTIETARFLKTHNPRLHLAPSVAHPFDIQRYDKAVHTLISVEGAIVNRGLFDWVWLDEWDRTGPDGMEKALYTQEVMEQMRRAGFFIAIVSPELHATSPGLLGNEAHQDARDLATLEKRIREIASYHPDAICTDYPDMALAIASETR